MRSEEEDAFSSKHPNLLTRARGNPEAFHEILEKDLRTFEIGPDKELFCMPAAVLIKLSHYFKVLLTGDFAEATSQDPISLPEDSVAAWTLFRYWIYYGDVRHEKSHKTAYCHVEALAQDLEDFLDLWILADKTGINILENLATREVCHILYGYSLQKRVLDTNYQDSLSPEVLIPMIETIPPGSHIYTILMEVVADSLVAYDHDIFDYSKLLSSKDFVQGYTTRLVFNLQFGTRLDLAFDPETYLLPEALSDPYFDCKIRPFPGLHLAEEAIGRLKER
ncbi:hypothetical protein EV356DRAFT_570990 [Viridothelium virens]|uniref:BTB domain-containing protein n=1 Tax=Viridothelium virens TaxID=1048519 RepID=A0A6A6GV11_VIRVR|nr:hypothetical protein EV356DRAFT_570990 [Viridothelium virens]